MCSTQYSAHSLQVQDVFYLRPLTPDALLQSPPVVSLLVKHTQDSQTEGDDHMRTTQTILNLCRSLFDILSLWWISCTFLTHILHHDMQLELLVYQTQQTDSKAPHMPPALDATKSFLFDISTSHRFTPCMRQKCVWFCLMSFFFLFLSKTSHRFLNF